MQLRAVTHGRPARRLRNDPSGGSSRDLYPHEAKPGVAPDAALSRPSFTSQTPPRVAMPRPIRIGLTTPKKDTTGAL